MTLIESRVKECFWLFGLTLPISEQYKEKMSAVFGVEVAKLIPDLLQKIANECVKYPDDFAGYLEFIGQSYDYCRGFSDNIPTVDMPQEDYQQALKNMRRSMKNE